MVDLIQSGRNGYQVDFANPSQIPPLVRKLQRTPTAAIKISAAAVTTAQQHTWQRVGLEMETFFQRLLREKQSSNEDFTS